MTDAPTTSKRRQRLQQLRDRFVALNLRSRALRLTRTSRSGALDLQRLGQAEPRIFRQLLQRLGSDSPDPLNLLDVQPQEPESRRLADDFNTLARAARSTWQETGAQELAVGWPILEGKSRSGTWIRAPLLLYPLSLTTTTTGRLSWRATFEGPPSLNPSLASTLVHLEGVRLTEDLLRKTDEDGLFKPDPPTWRAIVEVLHQVRLPLGEGQEAEMGELQPLPPRLYQDRQSAPTEEFHLRHHLVLGRFPRWGSTIVSDYEALLESDLSDEALSLAADALAVDEEQDWEEDAALEDQASPGSEEADGKGHVLEGRRRWQVLPSDASQDAVFTYLEQPGARGLVVQGPPGTGKSQLITNLIASSVGRGERVLLVCQKRAALDVVAARLAGEGLADPVALVNDVERDRNQVCETIAAALEPFLSGATDASSLDQTTHAAAGQHAQALQRLEARLVQTRQAWTSLTDPGPERPSLVFLQEEALNDDGRPLPDLRTVADGVSMSQALADLPHLESLAPLHRPLALPHPLAWRTHWAGMEPRALEKGWEGLLRVRRLLERLEPGKGCLSPTQASLSLEAWTPRIHALLDLFEATDPQGAARVEDFLLFWVWTGGETRHGEWNAVMERLKEARKTLRPVPHELIVTSGATLKAWIKDQEELEATERLWYRFALPRWWRLRKLPGQILDHCTSLSDAGPALVRPLDMCRDALQWHQLIADLPSDNAFLDFGFQGDLSELDDAIERLRAQHDHALALHNLKQALTDKGLPYQELPDFSMCLAGDDPTSLPFLEAALADRHRARAYQALPQALDALRPMWRLDLLQTLQEAADQNQIPPVLDLVRALLDARRDQDLALRLDQTTVDHPPWVRELLRRWRPPEGSPADVARDATDALRRAWILRALDGREPQVLEAPLVRPQQLQRLGQELDGALQVAGQGILARYQARLAHASSQRAQGRSLRKLAAQARKKRWRQSLRQIVEAFWDQGLSLVKPCWFCSPESVAALFPPTPGLFDLVIFDEASQCPVESAIPALVRSRRVMIAGDDQQMPPTHFFRTSFDEDLDDDDDDNTVLASRSILTLARVAFRSTTLRWHYRSRHEELVAFSNAAFYGRRLITAPQAGLRRTPRVEGLHWEQVPGLWVEQTNPVEAHRIVDLITEMLTTPLEDGQTPSVGVVTFNRKQARLIEDLLDTRAAQEPVLRQALAANQERDATEQLFVRNLENVQGDERDVILFSISYGPTEPGEQVKARFGPLGQAGGEKRLNVAITRARLGAHVVASFEPDTLKVAHTLHPGPKLLKRYLQFVRNVSEGRLHELPALLNEASALGGAAGVTGQHRRGPAAHNLHVPGQRVRDDLARHLEAQGFRVTRDLGLGSQLLDIAVGLQGSDQWTLGIDCSSFLLNPDDLSRDVYAVRFWKRLGWSLIRVTPWMWRHQRDNVLTNIDQMLRS